MSLPNQFEQLNLENLKNLEFNNNSNSNEPSNVVSPIHLLIISTYSKFHPTYINEYYYPIKQEITFCGEKIKSKINYDIDKMYNFCIEEIYNKQLIQQQYPNINKFYTENINITHYSHIHSDPHYPDRISFQGKLFEITNHLLSGTLNENKLFSICIIENNKQIEYLKKQNEQLLENQKILFEQNNYLQQNIKILIEENEVNKNNIELLKKNNKQLMVNWNTVSQYMENIQHIDNKLSITNIIIISFIIIMIIILIISIFHFN